MQISQSVSFQGYIPLKQYKGPVLKLTKDEEAKISALQENINNYEIELYRLTKLYDGKKLSTNQANYYLNKVETINAHINELKQLIREIKINRLNMQKTKN